MQAIISCSPRAYTRHTNKHPVRMRGAYKQWSTGRPFRRWQDDTTRKEGSTWNRKAADIRQWKVLMEVYILQWMDKA